MSNNYIIEIRPKPAGNTVQAGIVVRDGHGFRFFAATDAFYSLESQIFKNPQAAADAALRHVADLRSRSSRSSGHGATDGRSNALSH
jgi:hypothetical protein